MNQGLITAFNSLVYFFCLVFFTRFILESHPRKQYKICALFVFIPLFVLSISVDNYILYTTYLSFTILQFLLIKLLFKNVKLSYVILCYILLYCINMMFTSIVAVLVPSYRYHVDYIINFLSLILCVLACLTKIRYSIQRIIHWTPKYILGISVVLFIVASVISALISGFSRSEYPNILKTLIHFVTLFLIICICTIVPVIFLISISNTKLKSLTADYEQQIHAQAKHYKELAAANCEVRHFRHDFKNISIAIETLITEGNSEQALQLLQECSNALTPPGSKFYFDTGNGIADALLRDKQAIAVDHGVSIVFEGAFPSDSLSPTDLCVILGNTLDNAIDACCKLPKQDHKTVSVTSACNSGFLFLTVTNPILEKVQIYNNHIATTKDNKTLHGFGLYSLQSVIKKYDGELQLLATDDCFTVNIDLCLSKVQNSLPPLKSKVLR